jgi:hypothetical protein
VSPENTTGGGRRDWWSSAKVMEELCGLGCRFVGDGQHKNRRAVVEKVAAERW